MTESPDQANPGPHGESMWSPSKRVAVGSFISMAGSADSVETSSPTTSIRREPQASPSIAGSTVGGRLNNWPEEASEKYEPLEHVGSGTFGDVYKARRRSDSLVVHVKVLAELKHVAALTTRARDLQVAVEVAVEVAIKVLAGTGDQLKEVRLMQALSHPNICKVYDSFTCKPDYTIAVETEGSGGGGGGSEGGGDGAESAVKREASEREASGCGGDEEILCIVMDYAANGNLLTHLIRKCEETCKPLTESSCAKIAHQLLEALEYMHSKGIVHRDIKPENILIGDQFRPVLADFGLSKQMLLGKAALSADLPAEAQQQVNMYKARYALETPTPNGSAVSAGAFSFRGTTRCGTIGYMAPEVWTGEQYSYAADVWSFGCLIYVLLSGNGPFDISGEDEASEVYGRSLHSIYNKIPEVSDEAQDFIAQCLVPDQDQRATTVQLLQHDWLTPCSSRKKDAEAELKPLIGAFEKLRKYVMCREKAAGKLYRVAMMIRSVARLNKSIKRRRESTCEEEEAAANPRL